jgi:hypothetical protein
VERDHVLMIDTSSYPQCSTTEPAFLFRALSSAVRAAVGRTSEGVTIGQEGGFHINIPTESRGRRSTVPRNKPWGSSQERFPNCLVHYPHFRFNYTCANLKRKAITHSGFFGWRSDTA